MRIQNNLMHHVIGEAALNLINDKKPVSLYRLLNMLDAMAEGSADLLKEEACIKAIATLRNDSSSGLTFPVSRGDKKQPFH